MKGAASKAIALTDFAAVLAALRFTSLAVDPTASATVTLFPLKLTLVFFGWILEAPVGISVNAVKAELAISKTVWLASKAMLNTSEAANKNIIRNVFMCIH